MTSTMERVKGLSPLLFKLRVFYLLTGLSLGMLNPYISMIFIEQGLRRDSIGGIMALSSLLVIVAQLFWGRIADKYRATRLILVLSLAVPAAAAMLFAVPSAALMVAVYMLYIAFTAPLAPVSDAYAVTAAAKAGSSYGTIRCFQSIGNAFGGYMAGAFVAMYAPRLLGLPFLLFALAGIVVLMGVPRQDEVKIKRKSFSHGLKDVLMNRTVLLFLLSCLLINQTLTAFNTYFVVVFQMAGGSPQLSGIALMIAAFSNVPSMFLSAYIIRFFGVERTMLMGAIAYILRWGLQWLYPIPSVMVGVQVLQGLSFGLLYVTAVEYMVRIVPEDMRTTGQSILAIVFSGLAGMLGNLLNGYLLETGGPDAMNLACTISAALGAGLLVLIIRSQNRQKGAVQLDH
ncbi:MFS transporter [Paenibacillus sp. 1P07SE]|uniref:MFS transporter n=1 Tax=Paenibacillus sp. 1P07SE TaxID=3132209 RepID=UPI0039A51247